MMLLFRALILYVTVLVVLRTLGKRSMAGLTPVDRVVGITIGTLAGAGTLDPKVPVWMAALAIVGFGVLSWIGGIAAHWPIHTWLVGKPTPIIRHGQFVSSGLTKTGLRPEDVMMRLREAHVRSLAEVSEAFLEIDGRLGLLTYHPPQSTEENKEPDS